MDLQRQDIQLEVESRQVDAYFVQPAQPDAPGVVVIHEIWGLDEHIRSVVDRLAHSGYQAIAPDLFGIQVTLPPEVFKAGFKAVMTLSPAERAVPGRIDAALTLMDPQFRDQFKHLTSIAMQGATPTVQLAIQAAVDKLRAEGAKKVAVMGFCYGGSCTYSFAFSGHQAEAFAPFYGRPPDSPDVSLVKGPIEVHLGAEDQGIPPAKAQEVAAALEAQGQHAQVFVYEGAGHGFFNDTKGAYDVASAKLAWQRVLDFFGRELHST